MSQIATDLSLSALAAANEANWREGFCEMLGRWDRGIVCQAPDLIWYGSDVPHPMLNGVLACRFGEMEAAQRVASVVESFRQRRAPFWWWLFPETRPRNLGRLLEQHGLIREADLPGMAADLAQLPAEVPMPAGFTVQPVTSVASLAQWAEAYERSFPMPRFVARAHFDLFSRTGLGSETGWRHYVGLLGGQPVATSSTYLGAGVAGLYYVATHPDARGRGIGRAMVMTPLLHSRALGYRAAILQTTNAGRPLYERLGFRDCISFPQYRWTPRVE